ncbi:signal peptidase I [Muricauda sp. SCSIO 64092]|nr:signal peptidase I [Muricauda sp. SCSIO 64092]
MSITLKVLIFDIYKIPSSSMKNSLFKDDFIFVTKFKYGPKIPSSFSEIPWINILYQKKEQNLHTKNSFYWSDKRLKGTTPIENNDIVVFSGIKNNKSIIKRCIATPGDTLLIKNNKIYINNKILCNDNVILETSNLNLKKDIINANKNYAQVYPKSKYHHWSSDNYGPYVIPKKKCLST